MRSLAVSMFEAAVQAAQPDRLVEECIFLSTIPTITQPINSTTQPTIPSINHSCPTLLTLRSIKPIKQVNGQSISETKFVLNPPNSTHPVIDQLMTEPTSQPTHPSLNQSSDQSLRTFSKITLIAVGKAALPMAAAAQNILGDWIDQGLVVTTHQSIDQTIRQAVNQPIDTPNTSSAKQSFSTNTSKRAICLKQLDSRMSHPFDESITHCLLPPSFQSNNQSPFQSISLSTSDSINQSIEGIPVLGAGHPILDASSTKAGELVERLITGSNAQSDRLVLFLLSGGGSALCELTQPSITLPMLQSINQSMLHSGMPIQSINRLRKRLSLIKGGGLINWMRECTLAGLILSDVVGDDIEAIGSGPTVVPSVSPSVNRLLAIKLIDQYHLRNVLPAEAIQIIEREDTPINQSINAPRVFNMLIGSSLRSLQAAQSISDQSAYQSIILTDRLVGEVSHVAEMYDSLIGSLVDSNIPIRKPAAVIVGGETTVTISQSTSQSGHESTNASSDQQSIGKGGRNQHLAAYMAKLIARYHLTQPSDHPNKQSTNHPQIVFLSAGTDGRDGPTDAAGAVVDQSTVNQSINCGLDIDRFIDSFDSYGFFERLDHLSSNRTTHQSVKKPIQSAPHLIVTGMTGTNVQDIAIVLVR